MAFIFFYDELNVIIRRLCLCTILSDMYYTLMYNYILSNFMTVYLYSLILMATKAKKLKSGHVKA